MSTGPEFENEVRTIARALWPAPPGDGAARVIDGRERDCIFELEDITHYLEVTANNSLEKVRHDVQKMVQYRDTQTKRGRPVKLWIITQFEPSPHQLEHCRNNGVQIMALSEFRRHIIDAPSYMSCRVLHQFGSATNPSNDSVDVSGVKYQPVKILNERSGKTLSVQDIADLLIQPREIVLIGDYGMGKSLNIREVFLRLQKRYISSKGETPVPVVLNLRQHWGQDEPSEAIRRHANLIGFSKPDQLIRAFHAGRLALLLDGFDEISGTPWTRLPKLTVLRKNAVKLISNFVTQARGRCSVLIAGREHFFDSKSEMLEAFSLSPEYVLLSLTEFTDDEASSYLTKFGLSGPLPTWFPKRPLLLASLAARGLIGEVLDSQEKVEPAEAWDKLLNLICHREAQIHKYLDASGIRRMLEILAGETRSSTANLGPITESQIAEAFRAVVDIYPDETARPLLQRLPGLTARDHQDGSRSFMDDQLLDVLRGGLLRQYIENPWQDPGAGQWQHGIGSLGAQVVATKMVELEKPDVQLNVATKQAIERWAAPTLALDLGVVMQYLSLALGDDRDIVDFNGMTITGGTIETLDLANLPAPYRLSLDSCLIGELVLPTEPLTDLTLVNCMIEKVIGASDKTMLPDWIQGCDVAQFDDVLTNAVILEESKQPLSVRVLLTILRKLYIQGGGGRRENAFSRGLDPKMQRFVDPVLELIESEGLASRVKNRGYAVWYTTSGQKSRVVNILTNYGRSDDPVVVATRRLI